MVSPSGFEVPFGPSIPVDECALVLPLLRRLCSTPRPCRIGQVLINELFCCKYTMDCEDSKQTMALFGGILDTGDGDGGGDSSLTQAVLTDMQCNDTEPSEYEFGFNATMLNSNYTSAGGPVAHMTG